MKKLLFVFPLCLLTAGFFVPSTSPIASFPKNIDEKMIVNTDGSNYVAPKVVEKKANDPSSVMPLLP